MVFDETIDELYCTTSREVGRVLFFPAGGGAAII